MMNERTPLDDFFRERLQEHESPFSDSIFDRLLSERGEAIPEPNDTSFFKDKLENFESPVPNSLFNTIQEARKETILDNIFKEKLEQYASPITLSLFDNIIDIRENTQLSEIFKGKLDNHTSVVSDDIFDKIMATRNRRRFVIGYKLGRVAAVALLLLLASSTIYWVLNNKNEVKNEENLTKNIEKQPLDTKNTEGSKALQNIDNQGIASKNLDNKREKVLNTNNKASISKSNKTVQTKSSKNVKVQDFLIPNNAVSTTTISSITSNPITPVNEVYTPLQQNQSIEQVVPKTDALKPQNTSYTINALPSVKNNAFLSQNTEGGKPPFEKGYLCQMMPDGCPTFGRRRMGKTWYVEPYGAPEYAMRRLKVISSEYDIYKSARDTTETVQMGYATGVRAAMVLDNGIVVKGGVHYANGRERFLRDSVGYGKVTTTLVFDPITGLTDTTIEREVGIYRTTRFNQYRSLDFTLQGGYERAISSRFTLGINGGVNINIWQTKKAIFYDSALQIQDMSANENVFNQYMGVNLVGSIAVYFQMTERMQLMVEPYMRHYLKPITNTKYPIQQSYTQAGLAIGLRFRL